MAHESFYGRIHTFEFDKTRWTKAIEAKCALSVKQAAKEWVRAVFKKIPTWTGFDLGSIKYAEGDQGPLAAFLQMLGELEIDPEHKNPRWYYPQNRVNRIRKWPENAGPYAHYRFSDSQHIFRFTFRSDVVQQILGDQSGAYIESGPWGSFKAGRVAFRAELKRQIKQMPSIKGFIDSSQVSKIGV